MSHCFACTPCCCRACDPWSTFLRAWDGFCLAVRNPRAAKWLLGEAVRDRQGVPVTAIGEVLAIGEVVL